MEDITSSCPDFESNFGLLRKSVAEVVERHEFTEKAFTGWSSIPLRSVGGGIDKKASSGCGMAASSNPDIFKDTPYMTPCIRQFIERISGEVLKVRLLRLKAHSSIPPHCDFFKRGREVSRVHVPIGTNPAVLFTVVNETRHLAAGRMYVVDVSQRHSVVNDGDSDRIHLVFDVCSFRTPAVPRLAQTEPHPEAQ